MNESASLFQIIYNDATMKSRDTGFSVLDNLSNLRPDWAEYWPISRYFASAQIDDNRFYGFFSPRFQEKTGLCRQDLDPHLTNPSADVVLFSPYPDISALYLNQITQGQAEHAQLGEVFQRFFASSRDHPFVQTSTSTVYCNYFAARGRFWREWLRHATIIFEAAENPLAGVGRQLREATRHRGGSAPLKIFCVERIAGWMLARTESPWRAVAPLAFQVPTALARFAPYIAELRELDELKLRAIATGEYRAALELFRTRRDDLQNRASREMGR